MAVKKFTFINVEVLTHFVPQAWIDTQIILDVADPNYIYTLAKGAGVTGDMSTSDNGKTWTVSTISIPEFTFGSS